MESKNKTEHSYCNANEVDRQCCVDTFKGESTKIEKKIEKKTIKS